MTAQPEFAKNWMVEVLKGPPMIAPARQYVYPVYVPGEEDAMARGAKGERWQTGKLTDEGLRITDVDGGAVHGFGWKMMTDEEVPFRVDLVTGARD